MLDSPRKGDWLQTFTGKQFWPLDPRVSEIDIVDIAHSLSMQVRYGGHCHTFYSVAEHSYHMSMSASGVAVARAALMHDAPEGYVTDVVKPVKPHLSEFKNIEDRICEKIFEKYGIPYPICAEVHELDTRILLDERDQIMGPSPAARGDGWPDDLEPLGVKLLCLSPEAAKELFLSRFQELFG